jgi:hypothetical protein
VGAALLWCIWINAMDEKKSTWKINPEFCFMLSARDKRSTSKAEKWLLRMEILKIAY